MQEVPIEGFEGRGVSVELATGFGTPKLFVDGAPAPAGEKPGEFVLRRNDGTPVTATFKGGFPDPVPQLIVGGHAHRLAPPLSPIAWIWAGLPLGLALVGHPAGGVLAALAVVVNLQVMRSKIPMGARYAVCALVTLTAISIWVAVRSTLVR